MKKQTFEELLDSVRDGGAISAGRENAFPSNDNPALRRPHHPRTNEPFAIGVWGLIGVSVKIHRI